MKYVLKYIPQTVSLSHWVYCWKDREVVMKTEYG